MCLYLRIPVALWLMSVTPPLIDIYFICMVPFLDSQYWRTLHIGLLPNIYGIKIMLSIFVTHPNTPLRLKHPCWAEAPVEPVNINFITTPNHRTAVFIRIYNMTRRFRNMYLHRVTWWRKKQLQCSILTSSLHSHNTFVCSILPIRIKLAGKD